MSQIVKHLGIGSLFLSDSLSFFYNIHTISCLSLQPWFSRKAEIPSLNCDQNVKTNLWSCGMSLAKLHRGIVGKAI